MANVIDILQKQIDRLIDENNSLKQELVKEREKTLISIQESLTWRGAYERTKAAAEQLIDIVNLVVKRG